jgi:hypothetical protein
VAKRLDRFLVTEQLVDRFYLLRKWVGEGGVSDHFPIFLELRLGPPKPLGPLKFNKTWLRDDSFINLVNSLWVPYNSRAPLSASFQFATNLKRVKGPIKYWAHAKRIREDIELKQIEEDLSKIYDEEGGV